MPTKSRTSSSSPSSSKRTLREKLDDLEKKHQARLAKLNGHNTRSSRGTATIMKKLADVEKKHEARLAMVKKMSTARKAATPTDDDIIKSLQLAKKHAVSPSVKQTLAKLIEVTKKGQERKAKFASKSKNDTSIFDRIKRFFQGPANKVHPKKGGAAKA